MSKLVVRDDTRNQQAMTIANAQSSHDSSSADRSVNDWDMVSEFALEGSVEVLRASNSCEAVSVGQLREDTNLT